MNICAACGTSNPDGNRFCGECGTALSVACGNCGTENPGDHKFCGECGASLAGFEAPGATPVVPERRLVSVLFGDLVGFTTFSEGRDPEDVREMLSRYFDRAREIVTRFGGSVDKFIGDAVMAVWGAVDAHEDDAERAVRAGLELVDAVAELGAEIGADDLRLRAGVNTGETSVGPGGNEKGLVVGDLVNVASRLQTHAEPGTVLVGEMTAELVGEAIEFEALGELSVKGKQEPVASHIAKRVLAERGGRNRADVLEPPFVGRDDELRLLKDQLHATGREDRSRLVSIIGDAGIGKSRLTWELLKYIDGIAESIYWHHGRSPSYGDGLTFWALGEMIRSRAGIAETDDTTTSRSKLRDMVTEYVTGEDEQRWIEPRLAGVLGLDHVPNGDRAELFAALRAFFQHIARRGPTVLVFEDLHWADDGLVEFARELVERSPKHPILVVTLARPELLDTHPGWGGGRRGHLSLHLAPLSDEAMEGLLLGMVPVLPAEAVAALIERAGGVPLYAVEFVRMLIGRGDISRDGTAMQVTDGLDDLSVPESLQAVVGARLDRLPEAERETVQHAALLGQSFTVEGLAAVGGRKPAALQSVLASLVEHELLQLDDDPRSPERGQYQFVQSVIREVAYGRLGRDQRRGGHIGAAAYFESLDEVELAGAVAGHYLAAYRADPTAGDELLDRARIALEHAAERAISLSAHRQAFGLLGQAIEFTEDPAARARLQERAAYAAGLGGSTEHGIALAAEATKAYEQLGDLDGRLRAVTLQAEIHGDVFAADQAVALLQPVYEELEDLDSQARVRLALQLGRAHMLNRNLEQSIAVLDRALEVAEPFVEPADLLDGIISRASTLTFFGRSIEAQVALNGIVQYAEEQELRQQQIRALNNLGVKLSNLNPRAMAEVVELMVPLVHRFGTETGEQRLATTLPPIYVADGRFAEAREMLDSIDLDDAVPSYAQFLHYVRLQLQAITTGDEESLVEMAQIAEAFTEAGDAQMRQVGETLAGLVAIFRGDLVTGYERSRRIPDDGEAIVNHLWAACMLGDGDRIAQAGSFIAESLPRGRLREALVGLAEAGNAAIGGSADAAGLYTDAIAQFEPIALGIQVTGFKAAFSRLLGHDTDAGTRAGQEALAWLEKVGATGLQGILAEYLPQ